MAYCRKMQSKQKASQGKQNKQQWKHDTLEGLTKGSRVWFKASPVSWQLGTLTSVNTSLTTECIVALDATSGPGSGELVTTQITECVPANPSILDAVPDLTSLSYLNEPSILHDLHQRYGQDLIYTHAGPVLIAVNPFKRVPLYAADQMQHYKARANLEQMEGFTPHVFLTADKAYKAMCQHGQSQSLVISGESGAGKTETTKVAMKYLAGLAGGTGWSPLHDAVFALPPIPQNRSQRSCKLLKASVSFPAYLQQSQNPGSRKADSRNAPEATVGLVVVWHECMLPTRIWQNMFNCLIPCMTLLDTRYDTTKTLSFHMQRCMHIQVYETSHCPHACCSWITLQVACIVSL